MKSELHIQTAQRGHRTYLKNAFFTQPFKVADITEDKTAGPLKLMLMSSSPGVLDGDTYQIQINVAEGCSLELQTQSYQRLFTMKQGASQQMRVILEKGASFCFLPHPSVPHHQSRFSARNHISLSEGCRLVWGEVLTCGRKMNGEIFQFSTYHTVTEIVRKQGQEAGRLVVKENLFIDPSRMHMWGIGQLEGFTHQASLIYLHEQANVKALNDIITTYLDQQTNLLFGVTTAPINGLIVRLLGQRGEQLHTCLKTIAQLVSQPAGVALAHQDGLPKL